MMRFELEEMGFVLLRDVFEPEQVSRIRSELEAALQRDEGGGALRGTTGHPFAARNVLALWPKVASVWRKQALADALAMMLGPDFGLVRVLYFDKPPESSWALPWHKDLTIAVRNNRLRSVHFSKPTTKAGVHHVEAPEWLLCNMLTARIHPDDVTDANGPLKVIPGSHRAGKKPEDSGQPAQTILAKAGDVLLIRSLVSHCSNQSDPATAQHRRILHMEFAGCRDLPEGWEWHDYIS